MHKVHKEWQSLSLQLKQDLNLKLSPIGVCCSKKQGAPALKQKVRICRALIDASLGKTVQIYKENNACFGASWHLGFQDIKDPKIIAMIKKFVVEGEKLFSSYQTLDNLLAQMDDVPYNPDLCFMLAPMEVLEAEPELVIFVSNAEEACRLLTLATFIDGQMPHIKIGGPTCRMAITHPLFKKEINISFYDYTARKMCNVAPDKLLVSIPYEKIPLMAESIDKCSAGKAKIEYPQEFRTFLQKRLVN